MNDIARLRNFVVAFTRLVDAAGGNEERLLDEGGKLLGELVRLDDWLLSRLKSGVVRPFSHERTVARVTPTAAATSAWLSDWASRRRRRSWGEGSGVSGVRVMSDPTGCPLVRKGT